ncbi:unnamed protein product [Lampetra planeri]
MVPAEWRASCPRGDAGVGAVAQPRAVAQPGAAGPGSLSGVERRITSEEELPRHQHKHGARTRLVKAPSVLSNWLVSCPMPLGTFSVGSMPLLPL